MDPEREAQGHANYERMRSRISSLRAEAVAPSPSPGSLLAREDRHTSFSPLSYQVKWQLQICAHHLEAFDRLVQYDGTLPTYAGYALIRAAIESAGQAHWLLQHNHSAQRVLRAIRSVWWDHIDARDFSRQRGYDDDELSTRVRAGLTKDLQSVKQLRQSVFDVKRLSHTDMLTDVERYLRLPDPSPLTTWRLCSALTHGNGLMAANVLQRRTLDDAEPQVKTLSPSWSVTSALIRTTLDTFDAAIALLIQRGGSS